MGTKSGLSPQVVFCGCGNVVALRRIQSRTDFEIHGRVCHFCGRGIELRIERGPSSLPKARRPR
jgi:hypothetical protein